MCQSRYKLVPGVVVDNAHTIRPHDHHNKSALILHHFLVLHLLGFKYSKFTLLGVTMYKIVTIIKFENQLIGTEQFDTCHGHEMERTFGRASVFSTNVDWVYIFIYYL